jgi:hypothetical protein
VKASFFFTKPLSFSQSLVLFHPEPKKVSHPKGGRKKGNAPPIYPGPGCIRHDTNWSDSQRERRSLSRNRQEECVFTFLQFLIPIFRRFFESQTTPARSRKLKKEDPVSWHTLAMSRGLPSPSVHCSPKTRHERSRQRRLPCGVGDEATRRISSPPNCRSCAVFFPEGFEHRGDFNCELFEGFEHQSTNLRMSRFRTT